MNTIQKVEKVEALRAQGTPVVDACKKVGISAGSYYTHKKKGTAKVVTYEASTRPKYTRKVRTTTVNTLTVIMGTTEQVTELLRGLK